MIENEFFPTPVDLAITMISPYLRTLRGSNRNEVNVLEPSAGNGAILDALGKALDRYYRPDISCLEIDPDLRFVLQEKGYRVVGTDFLEYSEPVQYDLVVMNPPFSEGVKHVLKAWDYVAPDGALCALVNWETIANPNTREKMLLKGIIEEYGEAKNIGRAFEKSERPTRVEVGLIRLKKPSKEKAYEFDMGDFKSDDISAEKFAANPLAFPNVIKDLVSRYDACVRVLQERYQSQQKLNFYMKGIAAPSYDANTYKDHELKLNLIYSFNDQLATVKARFWNTVFQKTQLSKNATSKFRNEFSTFVKAQSSMAFSEENIRQLLLMFFLNQDQVIQDSIEDLFDKCTAYHEANRVWTEGWKTNKSWKVNKKVILPWGITWESNWGGRFKLSWGNVREFYSDIDQVLCYLSGKKVNDGDFVGTAEIIEKFCDGKIHPSDSFLYSTFFRIRLFKKGTVHLQFRDLTLLAKFNAAAARNKKWIGSDDWSSSPWKDCPPPDKTPAQPPEPQQLLLNATR